MLRIIAWFLTSFIQRSWSIQWLAAKQAQITTQRDICMSWLWLCSRCTAAEKLQFHSFVLELSTESLLLQMFWVILSWKLCCEMWEVIAVKKKKIHKHFLQPCLWERKTRVIVYLTCLSFFTFLIFSVILLRASDILRNLHSVISAPFNHL